jgi:hypothetical protein
MRMRKHNMLGWTNAMEKCLDLLENSSTATVLDKRLAAWVNLQRISDEWSCNASLTESQIQLTLKGFKRQLGSWNECLEPGVANRDSPAHLTLPRYVLTGFIASLMLGYHQNNIYFHESVLEGGSTTLVDLQSDGNPLASPGADSPGAVPPRKTKSPLSVTYLNAVMACIDSSHALLDLFLSINIQSLRAAPIVDYVRPSYALVVLIKLFISATAPESELGVVLDPQNLKIDYYMKAILEKLQEAGGPNQLRVPINWLAITHQINGWYRMMIMKQAAQQAKGDWNSSANVKSEGIPTWDAALNQTTMPVGQAALNAASHLSTIHLQQDGLPSFEHDQSIPKLPIPAHTTPAWSGNSNLTSTGSANYIPMDFSPDAFSWSNNPGAFSSDMNGWVPDENMGYEMNYQPMGSDWNFDLM